MAGVVALAALILLFWFCRRRRKADKFDGNFDPDRIDVSRASHGVGRDDLLEGAQVTPYSYSPENVSSVAPTSEMRQQGGGVNHTLLDAAGLGVAGAAAAGYAQHNRQPSASTYGRGDNQKRPLSDGAMSDLGHRPSASQEYAPTETSHSGSGSAYPYGASPYPAIGAAGAAGAYLGPGRHPSPGPSLPGTTTASSVSSPTSGSHYSQATGMTAGRMAKEREAFAGRQQQQIPSPGPSPGQYMPFPQPMAYDHPQQQAGDSRYGGYGYGASGAPLTLRNVSDEDGSASVAGGEPSYDSRPGSAAHASQVLVHQDAGRVPQPPGVGEGPVEEPQEIPPTYDSIRVDGDQNEEPRPSAAQQQ